MGAARAQQVDGAGFAELFEAEARVAGPEIDGRAVLALLVGEVRPEEALRRCHDRLKTALLTNNFVVPDATGQERPDAPMAGLANLFDVVIESSKVGLRNPDTAIYELVWRELGVAPREAVFLDDLGVNLKPVRAMGMTTIKVDEPDQALTELERVVGFPLR
jgi:putative hydrolase of the HAD superfamily